MYECRCGGERVVVVVADMGEGGPAIIMGVLLGGHVALLGCVFVPMRRGSGVVGGVVSGLGRVRRTIDLHAVVVELRKIRATLRVVHRVCGGPEGALVDGAAGVDAVLAVVGVLEDAVRIGRVYVALDLDVDWVLEGRGGVVVHVVKFERAGGGGCVGSGGGVWRKIEVTVHVVVVV